MSYKKPVTLSEPVSSSDLVRSARSTVLTAVGHAFSNESNAVTAALARIAELAESGLLEAALKLASPDIQDLAIRNARAVILMRLGRHEEAVTHLRKLVLAHNCTWMRPEVPVEYKANFATSLLLFGKASGCRAIMLEIQDENQPQVRQLRSVFKTWYKTLTFAQVMRFRVWGIQPKNKPVNIDFVPGSFGPLVSPTKVPGADLAKQPMQPARLAV